MSGKRPPAAPLGLVKLPKELRLPKAKKTKAQRPCAYGPRGDDGRCPKKPKSSKRGGASARSKKPCKYGPRDAEGLCPKRPSGWSSSASSQPSSAAGTASSKRTTAPKSKVQKVKDAAVKVGTEAAKAGVGQSVTALGRAVKTKKGKAEVKRLTGLLASAVLNGGKKLLKAAGIVGAAVGAGVAVEAALVQKGVNALIADTEKRLKRPLTAAERAALEPQYAAFVRARAVEKVANIKRG